MLGVVSGGWRGGALVRLVGADSVSKKVTNSLENDYNINNINNIIVIYYIIMYKGCICF